MKHFEKCRIADEEFYVDELADEGEGAGLAGKALVNVMLLV
jgi:hypothetical protein